MHWILTFTLYYILCEHFNICWGIWNSLKNRFCSGNCISRSKCSDISLSPVCHFDWCHLIDKVIWNYLKSWSQPVMVFVYDFAGWNQTITRDRLVWNKFQCQMEIYQILLAPKYHICLWIKITLVLEKKVSQRVHPSFRLLHNWYMLQGRWYWNAHQFYGFSTQYFLPCNFKFQNKASFQCQEFSSPTEYDTTTQRYYCMRKRWYYPEPLEVGGHLETCRQSFPGFGGRNNIKMSSCQYRDPHVKDKTVLYRPSYL